MNTTLDSSRTRVHLQPVVRMTGVELEHRTYNLNKWPLLFCISSLVTVIFVPCRTSGSRYADSISDPRFPKRDKNGTAWSLIPKKNWWSHPKGCDPRSHNIVTTLCTFLPQHFVLIKKTTDCRLKKFSFSLLHTFGKPRDPLYQKILDPPLECRRRKREGQVICVCIHFAQRI